MSRAENLIIISMPINPPHLFKHNELSDRSATKGSKAGSLDVIASFQTLEHGVT